MCHNHSTEVNPGESNWVTELRTVDTGTLVAAKTINLYSRVVAEHPNPHILLSNALGKSPDTHSQQSDTLNSSAHKLVKHMLSKAPEPGQSLVLDVDSYTLMMFVV